MVLAAAVAVAVAKVAVAKVGPLLFGESILAISERTMYLYAFRCFIGRSVNFIFNLVYVRKGS